MFKFLAGYRSYIIALIGLLVWLAQYLGWITPDVGTKIFELLGAGAVASLRAAISSPPSA